MTTTNGYEPSRLKRLFERPPPHSAAVEMALLGAMLLDFDAATDVSQIVRPDDFYIEGHGEIYAALLRVADKSPEAALLGLQEELIKSGTFERIGGGAYLDKLARESPGPTAAMYYAKTLSEYAKLRRLGEAAGRIIHRAYNDTDMPASEQIDRAEAEVFAVSGVGEELNQAEPLAAILDREIARMESGAGPSGLTTHFPDLDSLTAGFQPGDMIVLAARPSMGKSALMLNIAEQMALGGSPGSARNGQRRRVGLFTMEMSKASVAQRLISAATGCACTAMRSGAISVPAMARIAEAAVDLSTGIYADDSTALSIGAVRSRARRMVAKWNIEVLFIDYLQLMTAPQQGKESRQVEVSAISRGIKALARELNIPVVVLSQLNRGAEARQGNRPRLSDLRESGAIEQDADVVMLLHREDYYNVGMVGEDKQPYQNTNVAELIVAKQRNGPTDVVKLVWDSTATRFKSAAPSAYR